MALSAVALQRDAAAQRDTATAPYRPATLLGPELLPVDSQLEGLFPYGGLVRGTVVTVDSPAVGLALLAPVSATGSWCAVSGFPALGLAAVAEFGIDLARLVVVPEPGDQWAVTVATLLDGFDAVLVRPSPHARAADGRRLAARARERRSTVIALGGWPHQADLQLRLEHSEWSGLDHGFGRLTGRRCTLHSSGRGAAAQERRATVRLPRSVTDASQCGPPSAEQTLPLGRGAR